MRLSLTRSTIGAALFLVLGCVVAVMAARLPMGSVRLPGSGAFPLAIGASLIVLSVCLLVQSLRGEAQDSASDHVAERWGTSRVVAVCALVALYIFALPIAGFALDTALLMIALYAIGTGRIGAREIAAGLLTTAATYGLFVTLLGVRLPQGSLWGF